MASHFAGCRSRHFLCRSGCGPRTSRSCSSVPTTNPSTSPSSRYVKTNPPRAPKAPRRPALRQTAIACRQRPCSRSSRPHTSRYREPSAFAPTRSPACRLGPPIPPPPSMISTPRFPRPICPTGEIPPCNPRCSAPCCRPFWPTASNWPSIARTGTFLSTNSCSAANHQNLSPLKPPRPTVYGRSIRTSSP